MLFRSQDGLQKEAATKQDQTESEFWMPDYGEPFFAVDAVYGVTECIFEEGDDLDYMMVGNCFATAERAEQVSKKLEFLFRLEQLHDQFCPEFEPDWNDHDTPKIAVHLTVKKIKWFPLVLIMKNLFMRFILIASKQLIKWQRY